MKNIFLINALLLLISCGNSSKNASNSVDADSLSYETISIAQSFNDCDMDSSSCTSISFDFPQFSDATGAIGDSLNHLILSTFRNEELNINDPDSVQKAFLSDYGKFLKEQKGYDIPWKMEKSIEVLNQNKKWITLQVTLEGFTGGAHPNSEKYYWMLDKTDGHKLNLIDFFDSTGILKLTALGEPLFCAEKKIAPSQSLEAAGYWFPNNHFALNNNFYMNEEGITFYYNSYEVGPYANGPTSITIPASSVIKLMKN